MPETVGTATVRETSCLRFGEAESRLLKDGN
ncbi:hypothetical protein E2C01_093078 [Portunus trituberculatus]|uniref:Uncharacterized protein n=1 Tax=Portunus trituberculatus TaxID=210409 RepID=A0A5B7JSD1_PORTR|nr:hypothetical protein [Portunus trituberculatus]